MDGRELEPGLANFLRLGIDQVIFGGESGPKARPCPVEAIRQGVRDCRAAGVAAFVKQLGARPLVENWPKQPREMANFGRVESLSLRNRKGGDWLEWPEDLRVREYPKTAPVAAVISE